MKTADDLALLTLMFALVCVAVVLPGAVRVQEVKRYAMTVALVGIAPIPLALFSHDRANKIVTSPIFIWAATVATVLGLALAVWQILDLNKRLEAFRATSAKRTFPRQIKLLRARLKEVHNAQRFPSEGERAASIAYLEDLHDAIRDISMVVVLSDDDRQTLFSLEKLVQSARTCVDRSGVGSTFDDATKEVLGNLVAQLVPFEYAVFNL